MFLIDQLIYQLCSPYQLILFQSLPFVDFVTEGKFTGMLLCMYIFHRLKSKFQLVKGKNITIPFSKDVAIIYLNEYQSHTSYRIQCVGRKTNT